MNTLPANLAARLRQLAQSSAQALPALEAVTPDPPQLAPGQRLQVQIIDHLADGSYRARSALGNLRLQLPQEVESGATLDLEVTETRVPVVVARVVGRAANEPQAPLRSDALTRFTPAGRVIAGLLAEPEPAPRPLAGSQPLAAAPADTARMAAALRGAVESSGLFYESHQALWVAGKFPLERLRQEPQARFSSPAARPGQSAAASSVASPAEPATASGA
ncbi:MAG: hypothetical protein JNJ60_16920, partial [Rhodocyclaceae bacterium]|nr:hypothetical protein [Rhodocyclaceae bacterium]